MLRGLQAVTLGDPPLIKRWGESEIQREGVSCTHPYCRVGFQLKCGPKICCCKDVAPPARATSVLPQQSCICNLHVAFRSEAVCLY